MVAQETSPHVAFVGAGANLGDRVATLAKARERLVATAGILRVETSPLYETEPVGPIPQPRFLNQVFGVETTLTPEALLELLLAIEREFGRVRRERWGPRTLDLDLLIFGDVVCKTERLELPHPRLFERGFVTVPLRELLRRPHFQATRWDPLREKLGRAESSGGVALFLEQTRGERC